jgi:putative ABC transport system permease protein
LALINALIQDLHYALRQLRKSPGFTITSALTSAVGVGVTTAVFSLIHTVLLKPLPYRDPDRVLLLSRSVTPVRFDEMQAASHSFSALGSYGGVMQQMALTGAGTPEVLNAARVSANFLDILGATPLAGRGFVAQEQVPGAPAVAMISERLWRQRFGRNPKALGSTINLAGVPHTIIGVLPSDFHFPFVGLDLWVTKSAELLEISPQSRLISPVLKVFGRLKPNLTLEQANAELAVLKRQYAAAHPGMLDGRLDVPESLAPLKQTMVSDIRPKLWTLFGAVCLVLLIVCANVGGLLLARAAARVREFAVRAAIGASPGRMIRQLLAESILLAALGGALGVALTAIALNAVRRQGFMELPRAAEIHFDGTIFGFAVGLSTVTGVLFGLAPALVATKPDLAWVLRAGVDGSNTTGRETKRLRFRFGPRALLVATQVSISITLLIGATLLMRSLTHLYQIDPGFQPAKLLTMRISLSPQHYNTAAKQAAFYEQLVEHLESLPGVRNAAVSLTIPFSVWTGVPVQLAAGLPMKLNERPISVLQLVTPNYFRTMKVALKRGREFNEHDTLDSPPVAIINESLARHFWPEYPNGPNPIGQYLLMGRSPQPKQIVGIAADVHETSRDQNPRLGLYLPNAQLPSPSAAILVRSDRNPQLLAREIQRALLALDPEQPASDVAAMETVVEASEGERRLIMKLLGAFATAATLLSVLGLYGVVAYMVTQRTKEIGIRQALGAQRRQILELVLAEGFSISVLGLAVGLCAAFGLTRFLKAFLFQISATDPLTFAVIPLLFVAVALLACYIPAHHAAELDPMVALRYE